MIISFCGRPAGDTTKQGTFRYQIDIILTLKQYFNLRACTVIACIFFLQVHCCKCSLSFDLLCKFCHVYLAKVCILWYLFSSCLLLHTYGTVYMFMETSLPTREFPTNHFFVPFCAILLSWVRTLTQWNLVPIRIRNTLKQSPWLIF